MSNDMSRFYSISKVEVVFIYLFVILNSISGVQIGGKSVNTFWSWLSSCMLLFSI